MNINLIRGRVDGGKNRLGKSVQLDLVVRVGVGREACRGGNYETA